MGLLVRSPAGTWAPIYPVFQFSGSPVGATRPSLVLDETNRRVYFFYSTSQTDIYYKASDMDTIAFPPTGAGTPFMLTGTNPVGAGLNDPTGCKQNPDPGTGILLMASTSETSRYWHNWISLPAPRPHVAIAAPADGAHVPAGTPVAFAGSAVSATDGVINGQLRWTSSRDGQIGSGAGFSAVLSPGTHRITATATDGSRLTGTAAVTVTVGP
jgi:hypothetical protein